LDRIWVRNVRGRWSGSFALWLFLYGLDILSFGFARLFGFLLCFGFCGGGLLGSPLRALGFLRTTLTLLLILFLVLLCGEGLLRYV
jgi:hypothetical protein